MQKPARLFNRIARTPSNSCAVLDAAKLGDASSTTRISVSGGQFRDTESKHRRNKSARLWHGMTIDNFGWLALLGLLLTINLHDSICNSITDVSIRRRNCLGGPP